MQRGLIILLCFILLDFIVCGNAIKSVFMLKCYKFYILYLIIYFFCKFLILQFQTLPNTSTLAYNHTKENIKRNNPPACADYHTNSAHATRETCAGNNGAVEIVAHLSMPLNWVSAWSVRTFIFYSYFYIYICIYIYIYIYKVYLYLYFTLSFPNSNTTSPTECFLRLE